MDNKAPYTNSIEKTLGTIGETRMVQISSSISDDNDLFSK